MVFVFPRAALIEDEARGSSVGAARPAGSGGGDSTAISIGHANEPENQ